MNPDDLIMFERTGKARVPKANEFFYSGVDASFGVYLAATDFEPDGIERHILRRLSSSEVADLCAAKGRVAELESNWGKSDQDYIDRVEELEAEVARLKRERQGRVRPEPSRLDQFIEGLSQIGRGMHMETDLSALVVEAARYAMDDAASKEAQGNGE